MAFGRRLLSCENLQSVVIFFSVSTDDGRRLEVAGASLERLVWSIELLEAQTD